VVSAATAIGSARRAPTLLVDLDGDQPALLGLEVEGPGVADWLAATDPPPDALGRCEVVVGGALSLLPWGVPGDPSPEPSRWEVLARWLRADERRVVIDLGRLGHPRSGSDRGRRRMAELADHTDLVLRSCYLAVMAAFDGPPSDGMVVVREPGRSLTDRDLVDALHCPVDATVPWDPAVSRAVDAGLLLRRLPRPLRPLARLASAGSPVEVRPAAISAAGSSGSR
jgi:hypothetical protein